ncbi:MAG: hypothetical protein KDC18_03135 [Alphaproteobacteria bacterium]|nr:hypothetical protein [Alphaproteobacteria bacterium]
MKLRLAAFREHLKDGGLPASTVSPLKPGFITAIADETQAVLRNLERDLRIAAIPGLPDPRLRWLESGLKKQRDSRRLESR